MAVLLITILNILLVATSFQVIQLTNNTEINETANITKELGDVTGLESTTDESITAKRNVL